MKRSLIALFLIALLVPDHADAALKKKKRSAPRPKGIEMKEVTVESAAQRAPSVERERKEAGDDEEDGDGVPVSKPTGPVTTGRPTERVLTKARGGKRFDVRTLPASGPDEREKPEREGPPPNPGPFVPTGSLVGTPPIASQARPQAPVTSLAPPPIMDFDGLDRENWGSGSPSDVNGDAGPVYFIQSVNSSVGIYRKSDGFQEAAFSFDTLMAQGNFGNQCDTENFGDPVVLYDTFEDRWILSDFAFTLDGGGAVNPPIAFQCFAVSINNDPVTGGWNFYSISVNDGLNDYPKLGLWTDGIYMSSNLFGFAAGGSFQGVRVWAFNKYQMYAGLPTAQVVSFDVGTGDFTLMPSNARLQVGTPPPGTPNYFMSTWNFTNALTVYRFHVDWASIGNSTFTGPEVPLAPTSWPNAAVANAPQTGTATLLDVLQIRAMMQNQYTNFGGTESLWMPHTVRRANTTGFAAPRFYQVNVTGAAPAAVVQAATFDPDAANVMHRFMPSLAVDRAGNMAIGYSTSNASTVPAIKYAGRLSTDPVNTFGQTEQTLFAGVASQTGSTRWGDYTGMTLDPDGCTFWYTNQYGNSDQAANRRWRTRINSFRYPSCTMVGAGGTLSGTVTSLSSGNPISGATVTLGARSTTTNGSGVYSFTGLPAGTYPSASASHPGYVTQSAASIVITDAATTTQNFVLPDAAENGCLTDTTQADFQTGVTSNTDVNASPGDVILTNAPAVNQQNTTLGTSGVGITITTWGGQSFTPSVTGTVPRIDVNLFCSGCTGTIPNLTLSIRATAAGLPTGADLASATITGFSSGASAYYTATFGAPITLNSGTQYALVIRPTANPAPGTYALTRSGTAAAGADVYAGGARLTGATSGTVWSIPLTGGTQTDAGFRVYMQTGFAPSGTFTSSVKDANPAAGFLPTWTTLSWTATTPTDTSLQFQVGASNSPSGPFSFVGPGGTGATFFTTSGASMAQFDGFRYLQYRAYLATTNSTVSPTLSDVSLCFSNEDCSGVVATITPTPASVCANSAGNTATGPAGMTDYAWSIANGTIVGSTTSQSVTYTAGASGNVTLTLEITSPNDCTDTESIQVPIVAAPATPTITPGGPTTFCTGGSVTLTSSSATGNQWYLNGNPIGGETGQQLVVTASGDYTVVVTASGCSSAPSSVTTVTVNPTPATPTITPGGPTTFCTGGSVTLTSSSATGNQWYLNGNPIGGETGQQLVVTASGNYTVVVTASGCDSAPSAATTVTVNPIPPTPTITPGGPTTFCAGGSVTLTSSSATGNQWYLDGNPIGGATGQQHVATAAGNYTVVVTASGCDSAPSAATAVTVNPAPPTPTITPSGPTTFCTGGSVTLTSSSATGNQWYLNGNPIGGETNQQLVVNASGNYTVVVTASGCASAPSAATTVTVTSPPATPTITPGGPTTFCAGGSVTLTSSSATGNQWYLNGNPIGGETNQQLVATASGNYTVVVTSGCSSAPSSATAVTVNPAPPTPTISAGGPTTFCPGGSVTLTSSSASGNQWYLNGNPIGGETGQQLLVTAAGDYTVVVTASGCSSAPSAATTVTVATDPDATITAPGSVVTGSTGNAASVADAGVGATYSWSITNGTITGGTGTAAITFTAGAVGVLTLDVTVTNGAGCSDTSSVNIAVTASAPTVTVTSVSPNSGPTAGGTSVTIGGTGFASGASVTFGASAATSVVVVNATTITANTPAHAAGAVNVTVTNTDTSTGTLTNGYTYVVPQFDPNGDSTIDPSDIFYLVAYLFTGGPAPQGVAGMPSGDANGDGLVDPSDIFYAVNYLFGGGPVPYVRTGGGVAATSAERLSGALSLGTPTRRGARWVVPVNITMDAGSAVPQALSLRVRFDGAARNVAVRRTAGLQPVFEISRDSADTISYLVAFGDRAPLSLAANRPVTVAEIELSAAAALTLEVDPALTMLVADNGTSKATVSAGTLRTSGTTVGREPSRTTPRQQQQ